MDIKVLGPGCRNCVTLEERTREALGSLGTEATISKVTDFGEIAAYGVMSTPALVVDDQVVVAGRVPKPEEIARLIAASR
ncbi:MAG: thioredoxin family protein [Acidimicrobiia bacterium]|jgi:small redox-active disulfide protein 2